MKVRTFGRLGEVSALTLGGAGLGQVWGPTTRSEAIGTVRDAVTAGVDFIDVAPAYGKGESERVVGDAFEGRLPPGVRISTKCQLGNPPANQVESLLESSLSESLSRMRLERVDLFLLHSRIVPDEDPSSGTTRQLFVDIVRPVFERLVAQGRIGAWGITGIAESASLLATLDEEPLPAVIQCISNLLNSAGGLTMGVPRHRELIAKAGERGIGVMGIRAVQAGALTNSFDRAIPDDHPDMQDFHRAAPFRALAREVGESPASLAHRYALTMPGISTVVLGVKNRAELEECLEAEKKGTLSDDLMARIEAAVGRSL
jgi:aryl-alcohol dehydrogenase-like predicted oxidoreductase